LSLSIPIRAPLASVSNPLIGSVSNLFANAALSAAFVPVFTDLLQNGRKKEAFRLASTLFWIILIALGVVTGLWMVLAGTGSGMFPGALTLIAPGAGIELPITYEFSSLA